MSEIQIYNGRYTLFSNGTVRSNIRGTQLKPFTDGRRGYLKVRLYDSNGVYCDLYIHLLVLKYFGEEKPSEKYEGNHNDGDKTNNDISNLNWLTPKDNVRHAIDNGLRSKFNSISLSDVHKICKLISFGFDSPIKLSRVFGCTDDAIQKIKCKKNYKYISDIYF